jgi:hypothetical protein
MTAFTEGMTPAQFVTALNTNFTEYWGTGGVATILASDGYVAAINTAFGETAVAFGNSGAAFQNGLNKFNTFTHTLEDSCDGTVIDLTKWDITNLDPTHITFEQRDALMLNSLPLSNVTVDRNQAISKESFQYGVLRFSVLSVFKERCYCRFGLTGTQTLNPTNEILAEFHNINSADFLYDFRIHESGLGYNSYDLANVFRDFEQFKIIITPTNKISLFNWADDAWVQLGTTQTFDLGVLKFFMTSNSVYGGRLSIRDVYITSRDFSTLNPGIADEVRIYGENPDGVTDNASAINTALLSGDVYLKNGVFLFSESIKNPSNRYVYGKNTKILMANNSFDNVWRNSDFDGGNVNVGMIGRGHFVLDGNSINNSDGYDTHSAIGYPLVFPETIDQNWDHIGTEMYHYVNVPCVNVNGFEFSGLNIIDYPHFNFVFQHAKNGVFKNSICGHHSKLYPSNQDSYNIDWGCENIEVYNVKSLSDDDSTYLGCGRSDYAIVQKGPARVGDVKNINMHDNVIYSTGARGILLVASEGNKVNNIRWSNIHIYDCYYALMLHWPDYYIIHPTKDDMSDIFIDNVIIETNVNASIIKVNDKCKNIVITDLTNNSGKPNIAFEAGLVAADIENFTIEGVLQVP